ncbi:hypothetical protein J3R82DRAFT_8389 [Butyriboletus roseoflavus]|nr:hypothetical protein J3R82DRAFT_8389 [Butyriboletus roseoflavus]
MAGNLLWAHLLRKDATTTDSLSQIPPIAPQDKTGTSMRMLIHDTQVNLEKFSARLDGLLQCVDDCRAQVVNANKLLDVERDKVLTEILEIANRCQSEMKAHVGTCAQAPALDLVRVAHVSTEKSVQALEKRIDALQTLLQTHAHAMQSIQDQQNTLIGAVLPLVPILHGVPPQIDQIKAALSDMVANAVSTMTNTVRSTLVAEFSHGRGRAGALTRVESSSKSMSSSRRKRLNASVLGPQEHNGPVSSPMDGRGHEGPHLSLKRARVDGATHHAANARKLSRLAVPLTDSGGRPPPLLQTPRTPRQPLADLLLPPGNNTPGIQHHVAGHVNLTSRGYMRRLETLPATGGPSTNPTPMSWPPLEHACLDFKSPTITRSTVLRDMPLAVDKSAKGLPTAVRPSDLLKAIKIEEILEPKLDFFSSPLASPPLSVPLATRHDPNETSANTAQLSTQRSLRPRDSIPDAPQVEAPPPSSDPISSNPDASPPKSMSLRDRRAQISRFGRTETRRFIPLVPWSDEEE